MKKSNGIILGVVIVLLLVVMGVGGYVLISKLNQANSKVSKLENDVSELVSKAENVKNEKVEETSKIPDNKKNESVSQTNNIYSYDNIKGTYESQSINMNEGTTTEPCYMQHVLVLSSEGTFAYWFSDTDCHYVGYYVIDNNKLILNSVVCTGNDPSARLSNEIIQFTLSDNGTIKGEENLTFTRKSKIPQVDTNIAKVIDGYMAGCTTSGKDGQGPWFSGLSK